MVLDAGLALDLLSAAVSRYGPEHVTRRDQGDARILDTVFRALPDSHEQVSQWRGRDVRELWRGGLLPPATTVGAVIVLRRAQQSESLGLRWGDVLDQAFDAARSIMMLAPRWLCAPEIDKVGLSCCVGSGLSIAAHRAAAAPRGSRSLAVGATEQLASPATISRRQLT